MYSIEANTENILKVSLSNHKRLYNTTMNIIAKMTLNNDSTNVDYFKLKNIISIYVNQEIKLMNASDMNSIIIDYGFDNAINNYKNHYKILDTINVRMLVYNIICNNYFININVEKKEAINLLQSYIITKNNRKKYIKKLNIKRESEYLIDKINKEIKCDDAKLILNSIITKFVNRTMKSLDKA